MGLFTLHTNTQMHRDIAPKNIFLHEDVVGGSKELIAKLGDFGLARDLKLSELRGGLFSQVGTPIYFSPELLDGTYNIASDMWAIGVTLYQMLSQKLPFMPTMDSILHDTPAELPDYVPLVIKSLVKGLLEKNPRERITC